LPRRIDAPDDLSFADDLAARTRAALRNHGVNVSAATENLLGMMRSLDLQHLHIMGPDFLR
jgi:hypothetical protein